MADQTDPVADVLLKDATSSKGARADAWDAFHAATSADDLAAKLKTIGIGQSAKAALWDLKSRKPVAPPIMTPTGPVGMGATSDAPDQPGFMGKLAGQMEGAAHPQGLGDLMTLLAAPTDATRGIAGPILTRGWEALKAAGAKTSGVKDAATLPFRAVGEFYDALPSRNEAAVRQFFGPETPPPPSEPIRVNQAPPDVWDRVNQALPKSEPTAPPAAPTMGPTPGSISAADKAAMMRRGYRPETIAALERQQIAAAAKTAPPESPLQQPRVESGAERVGRAQGLTKEQVRAQTQPILGEAQGEASHVVPENTLDTFIAKMRAMEPGSPARVDYVKAAKDPKTMAQLENLRRTLEKLGLVAPLSVGGAGAMSSQAARKALADALNKYGGAP